MPSQLPGYQYDIFISYRQNDNRSGWVTEFVKALEGELATTIKDPVSVYFDVNPHDGLLETHNVDKSLEGKLKCLVFIPIVSQTYCDHKSFAWQNEFLGYNAIAKKDMFGREVKLADGNMVCRILPVKIHSLDLVDQKILETELGSVPRGVEFIYREPGVNRPLRPDDDPSENQNKTKYRNQVNKVAHSVKEIIAGLKNFGNPEFYSSSTEPVTEEIKASSGKSIVVLPFEDMSPDKDQEYFCDGLAEELINALTRIKDIHVVARTSAFSFKGKEIDVREIGKKLNIETLLEGSIRKAGNQLRITVQLVSVTDGFPIWSERYDRKMTDLFTIQDEISLAIVENLKVNLLGKEKSAITKRQTTDLEAYNLYLKACYFRNKLSEEGLNTGVRLFEQAIERDPAYGLAYGGVADCFFFLGWYFFLPSKEAFPKAKRSAQRALEIDENLSKARTTLGWVNMIYDRDWSGANREFARATELNPNDADAHNFYSIYLSAMGRHEESIAEAKKAQRLDPLTPFTTIILAMRYYYARWNEQAIEQLQSILELDSTFSMAHYYLAWPYAQKGMVGEALEHVTKAMKSIGKTTPILSCLGIMCALLKKKTETHAVLDELLVLAKQKSISSYFIAEVYVGLGQNKQALDWLEKAYDEHDPLMIYLNVDPLLDPVRSDRRFFALLKNVGLAKDTYDAHQPGDTVAMPLEKSIVVLPFVNVSNDPEQEYFCDGLAEELINALSKIKDIFVVARTSAFSFKGKEDDVREIGKRLKVQTLLEGSVRKSGNKLRITVQLINVADGFHLWSERYDREVSDLFTIQDEITLSVVEKLKINLLGDERKAVLKRHTANVEAHSYYLMGRFNGMMFSEENRARALEYYTMAVNKDPHYALAYCGLADLYCMKGMFGPYHPQEMYPKAKAFAEKALDLDAGLGEAYQASAFVKMFFERNWHQAGKDFSRALEVSPGSAIVHVNYSLYLMAIGKSDEAIAEGQRAIELDPLSSTVNQLFGFIFFGLGMFDKSIPQLRKALELNPSNTWAQAEVGWSFAFSGNLEEAMIECEKAEKLNTEFDPWFSTTNACVFLMAGKRERANKALKEIKEFSKSHYVDPVDFAVLHTWLGNRDEAFKWLQKGLDEGSGHLYFVRNCSYLWMKPISSDPRFRVILEKMGLAEFISFPEKESGNTAQNEKSIVVLPFENMSSDKENEYFSDGLTEEVIADLSKLRELSVISRSSAMTFKGTRKKAREIAEEVNVRYVLEGSVRKDGKNLRITAQLIDGATDTHAWSEKYAGTIDHVFEFQEQLSRSIVAALKIHLNPGEDQKLGERPIKDIRAYELYMKARNGLSTQTNEGLRQGLQHAKEALRIVGDNEILYGTMASINHAIWLNGFSDADKTEMSDTEICKEKILQLNPESPYGFFAAGVLDVMHSKPQEAVRNFKKTIALNPGYSEASQILGTIYLDVGRPEAADPLLRQILALDPLVAFNQAMIGYLEWQQGRFKSALPYWKKMIELGPNIPVCSWSYACALASAGLRNESCTHVDKMSEDILASPFGKMALLLKYGLVGNKTAAFELLTPEFIGFAKSLPFASRDVAGYYGMFGELDEAINLVENAINLGYINYPFLALHHPFYGPLRSHPRFIKLMERIRPLWEAFEI